MQFAPGTVGPAPRRRAHRAQLAGPQRKGGLLLEGREVRDDDRPARRERVQQRDGLQVKRSNP